MHIACAVITHGKPTAEQIDQLLIPYYQYPAEFCNKQLSDEEITKFEESYFAAHDSFPLWDWYQIGGRSSGSVVTPLDTPTNTLIYGDHPFTPGAYDDQVWGHNSDGAYIKDILHQHPLTNEPFANNIYSILTPDNYYDDLADERIDKIIFDIFGQSDSDAYLTIVDLHL